MTFGISLTTSKKSPIKMSHVGAHHFPTRAYGFYAGGEYLTGIDFGDLLASIYRAS